VKTIHKQAQEHISHSVALVNDLSRIESLDGAAFKPDAQRSFTRRVHIPFHPSPCPAANHKETMKRSPKANNSRQDDLAKRSMLKARLEPIGDCADMEKVRDLLKRWPVVHDGAFVVQRLPRPHCSLLICNGVADAPRWSPFLFTMSRSVPTNSSPRWFLKKKLKGMTVIVFGTDLMIWLTSISCGASGCNSAGFV
jgi:hypothetical protein